MHPPYYRGCWHGVSRCFLWRYRQPQPLSKPWVSSLLTEVYDPKTFFPHAASLRQAFAHCAIFPTAASRRSLDRVPVPVWPATLSGRLPIVALVSRYLTNKLMGRGLIKKRQLASRGRLSHIYKYAAYLVLAAVSHCYPNLHGRSSTRYSPVRRCTQSPKRPFSLDLHVLSTPPAFNLSQNQTLQLKVAKPTDPKDPRA